MYLVNDYIYATFSIEKRVEKIFIHLEGKVEMANGIIWKILRHRIEIERIR